VTAGRDLEYRLIGGIGVALLTAVHAVSARVPARETADADLGAHHSVLADPELIPSLTRLGYQQIQGNRFERTIVTSDGDLDLAHIRALLLDVVARPNEI